MNAEHGHGNGGCGSHSSHGGTHNGHGGHGDAAESPSGAIVRMLADNHAQFLAFLTRRVGDTATAEDILQDAFVRGMAKSGSIRDSESAVAWFYRVLRNAVTDHWRRKAAGNRALEAAARDLPEGWEDSDAEMQSEVCACVTRLAKTLKPEYADALTRVEVGGESLADFAESSGIGRNNAAVRVHRAREALRKQVELSCGTCAVHGCLNCTCDAAPGVRRN